MNIIKFPTNRSRREPLDWSQPPAHVILLSERAFRRGYYQGVEAALKAIERRGRRDRLRAWLSALYDWRMRAVRAADPRDAVDTPPAPDVSSSALPPEAA